MRKLALLGLLIACALLTVSALAKTNAETGESSATTGKDPLNLVNKDGAGVKDVTMKCDDTMSAKGDVAITCEFTNKSKEKKVFVICMMLDLKPAKALKPNGKENTPKVKRIFRYVLVEDTENVQVKDQTGKTVTKKVKVLKCKERATEYKPTKTAYHLGCHLIELKPGETKPFTWKGDVPYVAPPNTKVQANDFWINYADTIDLTNASGLKLDGLEKSCEPIVGQGKSLVPEAFLVGDKPVNVTATWVAQEAPFTDPVLGYQGTSLSPPEDLLYALFDSWPCAPPDLPDTSPPEGKCPRPPPIRPATPLDLNLYWFDSAAASPRESYPAVLSVTAQGNGSGVRLTTNPPAGKVFSIRGGRRQYGTITPCAALVSPSCVSPSLAEGARLSFGVGVLSPRTHRPLFAEYGEFVQDTQPPYVDAVSVIPMGGGRVSANVHAVDATTSPIAATLWCSTDRGVSWHSVGLSPTSSILDSSHARSFTAQFGLAQGQVAKYYVDVQDEVYNGDWFGPGTLSTSPSVPPPPTLTPVHAVFTQSAFSTVYTEAATGQGLTYRWTVSIPADPSCAAGFHGNVPQSNQATWYHADVGEGGPCNHTGTTYDASGRGHPGTVTVVVNNAYWSCVATYSGTQGDNGNPVGDGTPPQVCQRNG